jgi:hypothetical protein
MLEEYHGREVELLEMVRLAIGRRVIQAPLTIIVLYGESLLTYTKRRLKDSTAYG